VCALVPQVPTRTRFYIVRHVLESWKTTNTGRLAALALQNSTLVEHGLPFETVPPPTDLSAAWLLFPDPRPSTPANRPDCLVVLDGTWAQTKRMIQRIPWLRGLPRLSLSSERPIDGLRRPPSPHAMSTLTAMARATAHLEGADAAAKLDALHHEFVARVRALKGGPALFEGPPEKRS
jgi:DTW domain-containing protein YfiP